MKFFLYTRAGSLALLLAILALYLQTEPRSFGLSAITQAGQSAGAGLFGTVVLLGFVLGFGVKLPLVPLHGWLPDAHTEAPTAGSVMLAGVLLKMGGYGFVRIALPVVPEAFARFAVPLTVIAVIGLVYGAAVAMAQRDFKRLVAYTSVNHMGFVLLAAAVAAVAPSAADRTLALSGAVVQMVSHGLLTGGMFLLAGILAGRAGTRDLERVGGAWGALPIFATLLMIFAFGSFGLPTMSGFVAEFQVFVATLGSYPWAAVPTAVGVALMTALYLRAVQRIAFGRPVGAVSSASDLGLREVVVLGALLALVFAIGLLPGPLLATIQAASGTLPPR